jgi:hypothetical protein
VPYRSRPKAQCVTVRRREPIAAPVRGGCRGSVIARALWMFWVSLPLFWLPVIGLLLAGIVGGRKAGGIGGAIVTVLLSAVFAGTEFRGSLFVSLTT